jgi:hypothetical protein
MPLREVQGQYIVTSMVRYKKEGRQTFAYHHRTPKSEAQYPALHGKALGSD